MTIRKYKRDPFGNIIWKFTFEEGITLSTINEMQVPSVGTPMKMHFEPVYEDEIIYYVRCSYCRQQQENKMDCQYCGAPLPLPFTTGV